MVGKYCNGTVDCGGELEQEALQESALLAKSQHLYISVLWYKLSNARKLEALHLQ